MEVDVQFLIKRQEALEGERVVWESHWQEIAEYMVPRRAEITTKSFKGSKRRKDIFDSTAIRANNILAAGMHGQMTSPSMPWFTLRMEDPDLMKREGVRIWLKYVEKALYAAFNGSNFNSTIHEDYLDLGPFGTSCLYEEADAENMVRFDCRPISEIYIAEGNNGRIDTVHRKFTITARQAFQRWGEQAGENALKFMNEKQEPEHELEFLHAVYPRDDFDPRSMHKKDKPFASIYIELDKKEMIGGEGGYDEIPYFVTRWLKSSNEVYGRGPGMEVLPDVKMVNAMAKTILRAGQKMVDPPLVLPHKAFILPLRTTPGSNIFRDTLNPNDKVEPLETKGNIPIGLDLKQERRKNINEAFFVDLFLMLAEKPQMTATEVLERVEEKMIVLGPMVGRSTVERYDPMIKRTHNILARQGKIPPRPPELENEDPRIEYVSPLARAQKMWEVNATTKWISQMAPLGEVKPQIFDWIKEDGMVNYIGDCLGIPPEARNTEKGVEEIRAARAQKEKEQEAMNQLLELAEMMKKSGMKLTDLVGGAGG